mgnify:CR=1 FL=1
MANHILPEADRRDIPVTIRLSENERRVLDAYCEAHGINMTDFVRSALLSVLFKDYEANSRPRVPFIC